MNNYIEYINDAKQINPTSSFVRSCENFLKERGFLSKKQITALQNIKPKKPRSNDYQYQEHAYWDNNDYYDYLNCDDMNGLF